MPTPAPAATSPAGYTGGNWQSYSFKPWHPAVGPALALTPTVNAIVNVDELCVPDIYQQWGARACDRFVVTVPTDEWLHASSKVGTHQLQGLTVALPFQLRTELQAS